jgi:hypothetical protein
MTSRRNFLQKAGMATAVTGVAAQKKSTMTFIHHVLFWAKNPSNETEKSQLLTALKKLGTLPMIQSAHVGRPIVTEFDKGATDGSYAFSVVLVFESAAKESEYLYHPEHMKFIDANKHLWGKVQVIDSEAI